jgi:kynurenine formamidase
MRVIDLSHEISEGMPVYPGTEGPRISRANTIERDGFAEKLVSMYSHTGTHMDAPGHVLPGAPTLDLFEAGRFVGAAAILDVSGFAGCPIDAAFVESASGSVRGLDYLILRSGWSDRWGRGSYFEGFPVLSEDAARLVAGLGLKGIGLDSISADVVGAANLPIHRILFGAGLVIVENLANLEAVDAPSFTFACLPLKLPDCDGSPVRAVAILD